MIFFSFSTGKETNTTWKNLPAISKEQLKSLHISMDDFLVGAVLSKSKTNIFCVHKDVSCMIFWSFVSFPVISAKFYSAGWFYRKL